MDIYGTTMTFKNNVKYFSMTLDTKRRWKEHIKNKINGLRIQYRLFWFLG